MNNKLYKIIFICFSVVLLSSCIALNRVSNLESSSHTLVKFSDDQINAIGVSKQPILNFEDALVLVGGKYSYLVQSTNFNRSGYFKDIFQNLDLKYLVITSAKDSEIKSNTWKLYPRDRYKESDNVVYVSDVTLIYNKPIKYFTELEKQKLNDLKFDCKQKIDQISCISNTSFKLTLAQTIKITESEPYKLKHSVKFELYKVSTNKLKKTTAMVLAPVALVVDIVTFPIQMYFPEGHEALIEAYK